MADRSLDIFGKPKPKRPTLNQAAAMIQSGAIKKPGAPAPKPRKKGCNCL